jgi:hypothetical protein
MVAMYSTQVKERILSKTTEERDTLQESPDKSAKWTNVENTMFDYNHKRPLPNVTAQHAIDYINVIVKQYPFQLRYAMAKPLWERFAEEWCSSGDETKALRVI